MFLKIWQISQSSLFNKFAGIHPCNFIKKRLQQGVFFVQFAKFFRSPFLQNICKRLLLYYCAFEHYVHATSQSFIKIQRQVHPLSTSLTNFFECVWPFCVVGAERVNIRMWDYDNESLSTLTMEVVQGCKSRVWLKSMCWDYETLRNT